MLQVGALLPTISASSSKQLLVRPVQRWRFEGAVEECRPHSYMNSQNNTKGFEVFSQKLTESPLSWSNSMSSCQAVADVSDRDVLS